MRARAFFILSIGLALGIGCAPPAVTREKYRVFETGLLSSLHDGSTTRLDVLLRFGTPAATFEGGRILTYDFVQDLGGEWQRVGNAVVSDWLYPLPRTFSLVLVFGPDDRLVRYSLVWGSDDHLVRHNLVTEPRKPAPPVTEPAAKPPS